MRKRLVGGAVGRASRAGVAAPASAHDCFNPDKPVWEARRSFAGPSRTGGADGALDR